MNLGHSIGSRVQQSLREPIPSAVKLGQAIGTWVRVSVRDRILQHDIIRIEAWKTRADERTCPICGALDGVTWPEGEGFHPPAHDNCRCERVLKRLETRTREIEIWRDTAVWQSWAW